MVAGSTVRPERRRLDPPEYRAHSARVARVLQLSPHFVRITFTGPDLAAFGYAGDDQRVKILLPQPGRTLADLPTGHDWYLQWRRLPDQIRPTMRTYTVRAYREAKAEREATAELDVDFVLHGEHGDRPGPVSTWATGARPGDEVALLGPDRPGTGMMWGAAWSPPKSTRNVLLAGDETAVPAVAAILETLPPGLAGVAFVEVPEPADVLAVPTLPGIEVRWLVRRQSHAQAARGVLLEEAVTNALNALGCASAQPGEGVDGPDESEGTLLWDVPDSDLDESGDLYVWMAGEAAVMKRLRRLARQDHALPRSAVACMGYWRQGRAEPL